jgi:protein ImuB
MDLEPQQSFGGGSASRGNGVRTLVVWCPDWPVEAAIRDGLAEVGHPLAILRANRVVAASASARAFGVVRAMRRREAQGRCPDIALIEDDPGRDARVFEPVAAALDAFTPRIEIVRPGLCQFPTIGPSRYFGGDEALAAKILDAVRATGAPVCLGIADGPFAAALAARSPVRRILANPAPGEAMMACNGSGADSLVSLVSEMPDSDLPVSEMPVSEVPVIEPGGSAEFLSGYSLRALIAVEGGRAVTKAARSSKRASTKSKGSASNSVNSTNGDAQGLALIDLVDLLQRLGIRTLGALAGLPHSDVLARFGPVGERAWRLASGLDERIPNTRIPPADLVVETELDPPVERIDTAAFYAKAMAEELTDRLSANGLACTRILIEAETEDGLHLARLWRHERAGAAGGLSAAALADRMRWQLDGWLQQRARAYAESEGPHAHPDGDRAEMMIGGLTLLRLSPDEVIPDEGRQLGLWGGASANDERAARAFARVQALLGPESVCTITVTGGRRPADLVQLTPWGDERIIPPTASQPWPGRLPAPLPTTVYPLPLPVKLFDADGVSISVSSRGAISAPPVKVQLPALGSSSSIGSFPQPRITEGTVVERIDSWTGPWPLEERWWDPEAARRQARLQIVTSKGAAHLLVIEGGDWWLEASYL